MKIRNTIGEQNYGIAPGLPVLCNTLIPPSLLLPGVGVDIKNILMILRSISPITILSKLVTIREHFDGGRHSYMLVDIKCLSIDPPFFYADADLTPNDFFFFFLFEVVVVVVQSTPLFSTFVSIKNTNCEFWRASRAF